MRKKKIIYYDIRDFLKEYPDCQYYLVIGERSNGKTYSCLDMCLEHYLKTGKQFAYVRRWGEDVKSTKLADLWSGHIANHRLTELSQGVFDTIGYRQRKFILGLTNPEDGEVTYMKEPAGYVFDIAGMEHYKSLSYPNVQYVIFDEFLSRNGYLPNEFVLFQNTLSTIIRDRDDVTIIMLGNTVNKYCPYFAEMGLRNVEKMKPGDKQIYNYGDSKLKVAVEMTDTTSKNSGKPSDVYFAFDNPRLQMITSGLWEMGIYPHLPHRYAPRDVLATCYIRFERQILKLDAIVDEDGPYIFVCPQTKELKEKIDNVVYTDYPSTSWNIKMCLTKQSDKLSKFIIQAVRENRVFYADNETGETFRNYIMWSDQYNLKNV